MSARSVSTQTLTQFNQTIQSMQVKFCQEQKDGWAQHLDTCTFGYNTSHHDSTKFTPFELMFRRKAFLPIEATMQNEPPEEILEEFQTMPSLECKEGFLAKLIESRGNILDKTKSNISAAQDKQKADYDRKHAKSNCLQSWFQGAGQRFSLAKEKGGKARLPLAWTLCYNEESWQWYVI